ncbi:hypothetical protein RDI58_027755 [Solanum bulbocastanum]|uniref:Ubiquitin-like domain-containing protein n=1 Tax=Solanum bulbocastanum TaxID=147425 RepID=A0AAN8Y2D4_SOLBU
MELIIQDDTFKRDVIQCRLLPKSSLLRFGYQDNMNDTKQFRDYFTLMVDPRNIIGSLKAYIQEEKEISFTKQRILSEDGEDLNDAQTLFSLGIKKGSTLILRYAPITQISVRLLMLCSIVKDPWSLGQSMQIIIHDDTYKDQIKGRSFLKTFVLKYGPKDTISGTIKDRRISYTLMVEPNDTIVAVKAYIQEQIGFSFKNQKLLSKGVVLSDPQTLASLGIRKGFSLILRFAIEFVVKVTHAPYGLYLY